MALTAEVRALTLPSRGLAPAGFARLRKPLMSNVRLHKYDVDIELERHGSHRYAALSLLEVICGAAIGTNVWGTVVSRHELGMVDRHLAT